MVTFELLSCIVPGRAKTTWRQRSGFTRRRAGEERVCYFCRSFLGSSAINKTQLTKSERVSMIGQYSTRRTKKNIDDRKILNVASPPLVRRKFGP